MPGRVPHVPLWKSKIKAQNKYCTTGSQCAVSVSMFRVTKHRDSVTELSPKVMSVELIISNTHEGNLSILSGM
jgi:hypothetical protein